MTQSMAMIHKKSKKQALIWLVMAGIMLILWFFMSLFDGTPVTAKERKKTQVVAEDFALPLTIDHLNELAREVPPIDFTTVVQDLRNYPAEFKDKKFFENNKKRWTVQVMDVAQNEIITEYLKRRNDREKFAYFRYYNTNNEQRYILTYGIMGSTQEALGTIKTIDFELPKSIMPMPEQMSRYVSMIDNYERPEMLVNVSKEAPRLVKLQPTEKEIPAQAPKEEMSQKIHEPKTVKEEQVADFDEEVKPNEQSNTKPSAKPTAKSNTKPSARPNEQPNEQLNRLNANEQLKMPPTITPKEMPKQPKPQQTQPKSKPSAQGVNIADLTPAPPISGMNTSVIPGDE